MKRTTVSALLVGLALVGACAADVATTTTTTDGAAVTTTSEATTSTTEELATTTTADATTTTEAAATTTEAASGEPTIVVGSSGLGDILQDGEGRTLYLFTPDEQGDPTCYDACADNWPALVDEVAAGEGVDDSLLGTVTRTDGEVQVTYNGWPLYYFGGDSAPGDTNGQGLSDSWWVIDATGNMNNSMG